MITIRIRSIMWFAAGIAVALTAAVAFVGLRAGAGPSPSESTFVPTDPCRLFDTRPAPDNVGPRSSPLGTADTHTQLVHGTNGNCTVPSTASAVAMNVTITDPTAASFLTLWPHGQERPLASSLNWTAGQAATPNKVDVKLSADGRIDIYNHRGSVNVLGDVVGYYTNAGLSDLQDQLDALRVQTDVYNGRGLQYRGGTPGGLNGCEWTSGGASQFYLPLVVPLGATILDVEARVLDTFSTSYEVALIRQVPTGTPTDNYATEVLATGTGGELAIAFVDHDLTPPAPEVVDDGEIFAIRFDPNFGAGASGSDNELCRVEITYRR
ncbi:MAG: hypothetical protein HKN41_02740 [Ilumatobacter sp.]|nr:hypothetical protein [Ilumatobacter sp.]